MDILLEIKEQVEITGKSHSGFSHQQITAFEQRYDTLIEEGLRANPSPEPCEGKPKKAGTGQEKQGKKLIGVTSESQESYAVFYMRF